MRRCPQVLALALLVWLAVTGSAAAATVSREDGRNVVFEAGAGEVNVVDVAQTPTSYVFTDPAGVTPGAGCSDDAGSDPTVAECPREGSSVITVDLGDLADQVNPHTDFLG